MKHTAEGREIFLFALAHQRRHECGGMTLDLALFASAALGFQHTSENTPLPWAENRPHSPDIPDLSTVC